MRALPILFAAIGLSACTYVERERPQAAAPAPVIIQQPAQQQYVPPPPPPTVTVRPSY